MKAESDTGLLPVGFQFSQGSLQDFVDCPRRFQLRYIEHRAWPGIVSEPALEYERRQLQGAAFHRMVQQHLAGIAAERLAKMIPPADGSPSAADLLHWWENYVQSAPGERPGQRYVEYALSATVAGFRLMAKYDLLLIEPEHTNGETVDSQATILDWKTSRRKPARSQLAASLQTRVYRHLLTIASAPLNGGRPFAPEQIRMVYWFANEPEQTETFAYDPAQCSDDDRLLRSLIADICLRRKDQFPITAKEKRCLFCVYRSLCGRGTCAGDLDEADAEVELPGALDLDLDAIEEIEF